MAQENGHGTKRDIFINTASQIVVRFFTLAFALISVKLLTNYLGPAGTGAFNTVNTYINFFIVVADLGLFSVTVREIVKTPEKEKEILSNVFIIRFITALLASIIAAGIVFFTGYDSNIKYGVLVATGFLFFNLLASIYDMILQSRLKMQFSALAEFISKLIAVIALYTVVKVSGNFLWIVSTVSLSGLIIFIIKWFFAQKFISFSPKYNAKIAKWIFALSWPMGIVFILNNLYFKIDTLLLFGIKGAAEVGIYSVAYKVLEVTVFAASYFANSLKPIISKRIIADRASVAPIVSKSFLVMLIMSLPIAVLSAVFAEDIIIFLSNREFLSGSRALVLLSFTLPVIYLDTLLGEILVANDERKLLTRIAIFILSFNFVMNLLLIPKYSFMGAASVTLLSEVVLLVVNIHYTRKIVPYAINSGKILSIIFASALTFWVSLSLKNNLSANFIILIGFSFIFYAALIYALKVFSFKSLKEVIRG